MTLATLNFDEVVAKLSGQSEETLRRIQESVQSMTPRFRWQPNPGPQTQAYVSKADVLLYGGEPGGGKTQLLLGLAFNEHRESMIFRRKYTDLDRIIRDALKIHGSRDGFNGSAPPRLKLDDDRLISFRAANNVGDEQSTMGDGRDFLGIDEATHFAKSQIQFLMGWVRTDRPGQRTRTVLATNPPLAAEGLWVIEMFAPWLDPQFPVPAKPGELRWVVSDEDGNDRWVSSSDPVEINGKLVQPKSRTYIPASVKDNPYYVNSDYQRELDAMPEPFRSILMGGFRTSFKDAENQVIPTAWVQAAQARWRPEPPSGVPCCAMGVDMSGGGSDPMTIAPRWDGWYDNIIEIPGKEIPQDRAGSWCAGQVLTYRCDQALVVVDLGGGYGGSMYERLKENGIEVVGFRGAEATPRRSKEGKFKFTNKRSAAHWLFREALDPGQPGGSPIALPPSPRLVADLTAATFEVGSNGIKVEPKDAVCARLGRSTDYGDAVIMAWFEGDRQSTKALDWIDTGFARGSNRRPQVIGSRVPALSSRRYRNG
jgi:hypothetical protein